MSNTKRGISIDIGTKLIRIVSYKKTKKVFKVNKAVTVEMPDCKISDGFIEDVDILAATLSECIKKNKIKGKNVDFTISSNKIITREVNYPDLAEKKLAPLIRMNSDEYFPVDLSKYTLNYEILEHYSEDMEKFVRTNTVVIPTEIVDCYVKLAKLLKLKLTGISYVENAMMNYALLVDDEKPYMVVDFGSERSSVAIVSDRKIVLNRTLSNGVNKILDLVKARYGVEYDRAIEVASEKNFIKDFSQAQDGFTIKVTSYINLIINGIARLLDYYSSKNKSHIDTIYLTGIGANIKGLDRYIGKYFGIETKLLDDITTIQSSDIKYLAKKNLYANAIGSIYSDLNLIPDEFIRNKKTKEKNRIGIEVLVLILVLALSMLYFPIKNNIEMGKEKEALEAKLAEYKKIEPILARRESLGARAQFLEEIDRTYSADHNVVEILEVMEKNIPKEVSYGVMGINKEGIIITCDATDKNVVVNFLEEMKKLKIGEDTIFTDVFIASVSAVAAKGEGEEDETESYSFTITCLYKEVGADER